ncbi:MAG: (2Fe-2S) ferredoxin domain-containing protein [Magnetococcales bacterium]|nr:(2Fe-2S) ferredoxin domain-containing protein [Magnetococcales bacterium]
MEISLITCIKERFTGKPSCAGRGSVELIDDIEKEIKNRGLPVVVERVHCLGECAKGPNMRIAPGGSFFYGMNRDKIPELMESLTELSKDEK